MAYSSFGFRLRGPTGKRSSSPPDITYNPTRKNIPYSSHSLKVVKALARDRLGNTGGR